MKKVYFIGNGNLTLKNQKLLAIYILGDIIRIRSVSNLNDLDIKKHSALDVFTIPSNKIDPCWSLNVGWIMKSPLFY